MTYNFSLGSFSSLEKETQPTKYDSEKLIRRDLFDMFKVTFSTIDTA